MICKMQDPADFDNKKIALQNFLLELQNKGELSSPDRMTLMRDLKSMHFGADDLSQKCADMEHNLDRMVH